MWDLAEASQGEIYWRHDNRINITMIYRELYTTLNTIEPMWNDI